LNFLKHFNFFTADELEKIIITLENDVNTGEMIPLERAQYLLRQFFPTKEQYFDKVYQYWVTRRDDFKKPLLRKFWKDQKCSDKHLGTTFRKREVVKMRTRRYKKNDSDELQKLKEIKSSMEQCLMNLLKCIKDREHVKKQLAILDHLNFKGEISMSKNGPAIDKEWNNFIGNYQKIKSSFAPKFPREQPVKDNKENILKPSQSLAALPLSPNNIPQQESKKINKHHKQSNSNIEDAKKNENKKPIRKAPKHPKLSDVGLRPQKDSGLNIKKEEIERIKYLICKDRFNRNVIHRYISSKNSLFYPFDEDFTKDLIKSNALYSNSPVNNQKENSFQNYFEKYAKERYSKLYPESDEEDNMEYFQKEFSDISSNLKQFLKKKKDSSTRYILQS